jgi:hypothetical protein
LGVGCRENGGGRLVHACYDFTQSLQRLGGKRGRRIDFLDLLFDAIRGIARLTREGLYFVGYD